MMVIIRSPSSRVIQYEYIVLEVSTCNTVELQF
jgi:hypothetical protein